MRALLFVSGTAVAAGVAGLLVWRPTLALALALIGFAVNIWRMQRRPHRAARTAKAVVATSTSEHLSAAPSTSSTPSPALTPAPIPSPTLHADLLERVRDAGWSLADTGAPAPWLVLVCGGSRVALRAATIGPAAATEDIVDAVAAKAREQAQYAAIVCEHRPPDDVAALARNSLVHIVTLERLEAYLALAGSFKPAQPPAARVTA